ncbi:putative signal peptide protein [Puccinia sorghi]|uniref:Putative signal peptide protein n=1 Tax=Puccinia sorghi TaxID=27349 RepID=A0A0L6UJE0_9BASI|nr:putative signal peptide protein [Puccinia sorghi]
MAKHICMQRMGDALVCKLIQVLLGVVPCGIGFLPSGIDQPTCPGYKSWHQPKSCLAEPKMLANIESILIKVVPTNLHSLQHCPDSTAPASTLFLRPPAAQPLCRPDKTKP